MVNFVRLETGHATVFEDLLADIGLGYLSQLPFPPCDTKPGKVQVYSYVAG